MQSEPKIIDHREIFISPDGTFSTGNELDGIVIELESERERIIRERFHTNVKDKSGSDSGVSIVKAPMPGLVRSILVKIGEQVQKGSQLVILEAMKMENVITAPAAGAVSKIHVSEGGSIEKNSAMLEISSK